MIPSVRKKILTQTQPYLGQSASRCYIPNTFDTGQRQSMSRSRHRARGLLNQPILVWPNWYVNGSFADANTTATITIFAGIEYPVGVFTQVKFAGATSGAAAAGNNVTSDAVNIQIPDGEFFFVRTYYQSTTGVLSHGVTAHSCILDLANGEALTYGNPTVTDQTMGGTVADTGTVGALWSNGGGYLYTPCAILSMKREPSFLLLGDSRCVGEFDSNSGDASCDNGEIARSIGKQFGYINAGRGSSTAAAMVSSGAKRAALQSYVTHVISAYGGADLRAGSSAATVLTSLQSLWALFPTKKVYQSTITPFTTSSDSWKTTGNQTDATGNTARATLNGSIRTTTLIARALEVADQVETARDSGRWKNDGSTNFLWTGDGIHPSQFGYQSIRDTNIIYPADFKLRG